MGTGLSWAWGALFVCSLTVGCGGADDGASTSLADGGTSAGVTGATGGMLTTGGAVATGGGLATGGESATGGEFATGGAASTGGAATTTSDFPVSVSGSHLVRNDGTGKRFFAAGMVDNRPSSGQQLSRYDSAEMEEQLATHERIGVTVMRWNTFLKGIDLRWDGSGHVSGMSAGAVANIRDGLDLAQKHGVLVQITLSTGHFLQWGYQGATPENTTRVANNKAMYATEAGTQAYIDNALIPILEGVGRHPALFGYLIVNEAHAMIDPADTPNGSWTDEFVRLNQMQRFINRVAGTIHDRQPGAMVTVSVIAKLLYQLDDAALIAAGGDPKGILDWYQVQFYPQSHIEEWSPFERTAAQLNGDFAVTPKPILCGEFPIEGMVDRANKNQTSAPFGLEEAYERLWDNGQEGGFTWSYNVYAGMSASEVATTDGAYETFAANHPQ